MASLQLTRIYAFLSWVFFIGSVATELLVLQYQSSQTIACLLVNVDSE
jgi:hypothetical protein